MVEDPPIMVAKRDPTIKRKGPPLSATKKLSIPFTTLRDLLPTKIRAKKYIKTIAISICYIRCE